MKHNHSIGSFAVIKGSRGFTLIELMLTMLISGIIVAAIYSAYMAQQRTYLAQEQVAEMQQNIRAGLDIMIRELRMAGYDPDSTGGAGITTANANQIIIAMVADDDGIDNDNADNDNDSSTGADEPGELKTIQYDLYVNTDGVTCLGRKVGSANRQAVALHFDGIEFSYLDSADAVTTVLADIRSIQLSLLARAGQPDRKFTNSMTYTTASGNSWGPYGDNFRRRLLITTVNCRNMGL